jgi:hypothetical protein
MGQKQSLSLPAESTVTGLDPPFSKHDDCAGLFEWKIVSNEEIDAFLEKGFEVTNHGCAVRASARRADEKKLC